MKRITLDFETRSRCDLKKAGAYKYSLDPTTQPTCLAFKIHGGKVILMRFEEINTPWKKQNQGFRNFWESLLEREYLFTAHNAFFERCIYTNVLVKRYGWPPIPVRSWRCTAAKAAAVAIPRNLEGAGEAMRLSVQKDKRGYNAMMATCKPTKQWNAWTKAKAEIAQGKRVGARKLALASKPEPPVFLEYKDNPTVWETLYTYCKIDVRSEEKLDESLPDLIPDEQEIWHLNQKLNWRGLRVDIPTVKKIVALMETESKLKLKELDSLTLGLVTKPGARKSILEFLALEDIILPDIRAKTVEDVLKKGELSDDMRRLLEIRQALSKTSTKKYQGFLDRAGRDDRVRDILLYHGASTGRDTGTGVQPHNFPRGAIEIDDREPYAVVENVSRCEPEMLSLLYGSSLSLVFSSILRNMLMPSEGSEMFVADFSKIEVAVLWWLGQNSPGLKILNSGKDPYIYLAAANTGKTYKEVEAAIKAGEKWAVDARQLGKAQVLGCIAKGTPVLTQNGPKPIEKITKEDELWDGQKYVRHGGLVRKGLKPVIRIESHNISVTHDHWVKQSGVWRSAGEIVLNKGMKPPHSAWFLRDGRLLEQKSKSVRNVVSLVAAYVELKRHSEWTDFGKLKRDSAFCALNLSTPDDLNPTETAILLVMHVLESVGQRVSTTSKKGARGGMIRTSTGMEVAEFVAPSNPLESFWNILLRLMGLISGGFRWTELITMGTMSPETYESRLSELTTETAETYDIEKVGEKNQFQVGKCIAHNCGFGMGWEKFKATAWDQYRLKLSDEQSKTAVKTYREANEAVPILWKAYEQAAIMAIEDKVVAKAGKCKFYIKGNFLRVRLPSGRCLSYLDPRISWRETEYGPRKTVEFLGLDKSKKKMQRERTWGGTLTENIVQAVARDLMMPAMVRLEKAGYRALLAVHDEAITEKEKGKGSLKEFVKILLERPSWADESLPLDAKGWVGPRYRK